MYGHIVYGYNYRSVARRNVSTPYIRITMWPLLDKISGSRQFSAHGTVFRAGRIKSSNKVDVSNNMTDMNTQWLKWCHIRYTCASGTQPYQCHYYRSKIITQHAGLLKNRRGNWILICQKWKKLMTANNVLTSSKNMYRHTKYTQLQHYLFKKIK